MGVVWEAFDRERNQRVALKTLRRLDAEHLYRFKREFRSLQGLEHPNLVRLGELFESDGRWFFTMELVEGVAFLEWVRPGGKLDWTRLRLALQQLAVTLTAVHAAGKVHRDVKPSNTIVTPSGRLVLLDFGVVMDARLEQTTGDRVLGTAAYMAPEQAFGGEVGPAADWYALGVMMYQAMTGTLPHEGGTVMDLLLRKRTVKPAPVARRAPAAPPALAAFCEQLLAIVPEERPGAARILEVLGAPAAAEPGAAPAPPLIGRERELDVLRGAYAEVCGGAAVSVVVRGVSGIGKSALLRQFLAGLDGALVLAGRCYERELVRYKAFDDVADALARALRAMPAPQVAALLPRHAALLPRIFATLARVEAIAAAPQPGAELRDPVELRARAFTALRELLQRAAERQPLVIAIDDLQWADADSLLLLRDLLRPPDAPPLLLLATSRAEAPADLGDHVRTIALGELAPAAAEQLAAQLLAAQPQPGGADPHSLAAEAGGHPLFLAELARRAASGAATAELRLDEVIRARSAALPDDGRRLLALVALAGGRVTQEAVRIAAELDGGSFDRVVSILRAGQLVTTGGSGAGDAIEPFHDRVREAVIAGLNDSERAGLHARLVAGLAAVDAAGDRPELLVRHLEGAGRAHEAADHARVAGERARDGLALDRAAELYRTALRLGDWPDGDRRELQRALATTLVQAGHGEPAADAFLQVARDAEPAVRIEAQAGAMHQLLISGRFDRGLQIARDLVAEVGSRWPRSRARAIAGILARRLWLRLRGYRWRARDPERIPSRLLNRLDVFRAAGEGLSMFDPVRGAYFHTRSVVLALSVGDVTRIHRLLGLDAIYFAARTGKSITAHPRLYEQLRNAADDDADPYTRVGVLGANGMVALFAGEYRRAADLLGQADELFASRGQRPAIDFNNVRIGRLIALRQIGALPDARRLLADYLADAEHRGDLYALTTLRRTSTVLWLAADRPDLARASLDQASWAPPTAGFQLQHWYELEGRAQIAFYQGAGAAELAALAPGLRAMARSLVRHVASLRQSGLWLRGRLALAAADAGDRAALRDAARAARRLEREGAVQPAAMAELLRAGVAHLAGNRERAAELLRDAVHTAERAELLVIAHCARRVRGCLLGGERGAAMVAEADAWLGKAGVAAPARLVRVVLPGFRAQDVDRAPAPTV
jgi:hypothetical protein